MKNFTPNIQEASFFKNLLHLLQRNEYIILKHDIMPKPHDSKVKQNYKNNFSIWFSRICLNNDEKIYYFGAGDGGIALYSKEGTVNISSGSKITVGATLGNGQEGTGVYLAGNNQTLNSDTDQLTIGQGSVGYVMTGQGNTVRTGVAGTTGVVTLSKDSVYMYSADKTGNITNYTNLRSIGDENYGIYAPVAVSNYGKY